MAMAEDCIAAEGLAVESIAGTDFVAVTGWMELSTACMYLLKAMLALTALLLLVEKLPHALLTQL